MSALATSFDCSSERNAPVPSIADTLASICRAHHDLSDELRPAASSDRPSTTALTSRQASRQSSRQASRQQSQRRPNTYIPPAAEHAGRPRSSDKRGYNTLEELLDLAPPDASTAGGTAQSARSVLGRRGTPVAIHFKIGDVLGEKSWGSSEPRKLDANSGNTRDLRGGSPIPTGKDDSPRSRGLTTNAGKKRGKKKVDNTEDNLPNNRKGKRDTAELPLIAHEVEAKVLKDLQIELADPKVSEDWSTMFSLVHHKAPPRQVAVLTDEDVPSRPVTSRSRTTADDNRPPSPLRPGVYAGHDITSAAAVVPKSIRTQVTPRSRADTMDRAEAETMQLQKSMGRRQTVRKSMRPKFDPLMMARINRAEPDAEDEKLAEERRQYALWKKKVIESARTLHLEVNRFQVMCEE